MAHSPLQLLLVLLAIPSAAQTARDLNIRYGAPDAQRFVARSTITLMARYASDQTACEMLIEPANSNQRPAGKEASMENAVVSEIVNELVPESRRGSLIFEMIEDMGASEADVTEYQDVIISHHFVRYLATGHNEISATIVRKDGRCRGTMASQKYPAIESTFIESTSTDLYVRYGEPGTERFVVRPGITLTAGYGFDRTACQMVIEPTRSIIPRVELATYMLPEVVTAIIDEVLPEPDRGELILGVVTKSGCNDLETLDYQNVTITRFRHKCELPKPEIEGAANIKRKGPGCGDNGK